MGGSNSIMSMFDPANAPKKEEAQKPKFNVDII